MSSPAAEPGAPSFLPSSDPYLIEVGIGEIATAKAPRVLMTPALGSCVGVAIYDAFSKKGCLAHVMLPNRPTEHDTVIAEGRFADTAIPLMVKSLQEEGTLRRRMQAKIAGGAAMFHGDTVMASIGGRNVAEVKRQLALLSIPLVAEDTGESHARTVELVLATGEFLVRSYQFGVIRQ